MNTFPVTNWTNHAGACCESGLNFYFNSIDEITGQPLSGAQFHLCHRNEPIAHSASNAKGMAGFRNISPGWYSLVQSVPPSGYQSPRDCWLVLVENDGTIWVDGIPENQFQVLHLALPNGQISNLENESYRVFVVDIDVTGIQLLGCRADRAEPGQSITLYAKSYPGYYLISPASHTFFNLRQEERWAFRYRKLSLR